MSNPCTDAIACLVGISLAVATAVIGIKTNVDHRHAAALKPERVAQLSGNVARHGSAAARRPVVTGQY